MNKQQFKFSPGWNQLSPAWHALAALVLSCLIVGLLADVIGRHASQLEQAGHLLLANLYRAGLPASLGISLLVLLPRTHNVSRIAAFRLLGRMPLLLRYFLAAVIAFGLYGLGTVVEKLAI